YIVPPGDWRPWLGIMGVLNSIGLVLYKAILHWRSSRPSRPGGQWVIDRGRFLAITLVAMCVSAFVQSYLVFKFGGYQGMLDLFLLSLKTGEDTMAGLGWTAAIGESLPMLLVLAYAVFARQHSILRSWSCLSCMLVAVFVLQLIIGGYRGSRGNT